MNNELSLLIATFSSTNQRVLVVDHMEGCVRPSVCAAKIMHLTLLDFRDPGTCSYLLKFQEECHLLSLARHPNVVQYLAIPRHLLAIGQMYGKKSAVYIPVTRSTLASFGGHLLAIYILVGEMTHRTPPPLMSIDMIPTLTHGMSLVR